MNLYFGLSISSSLFNSYGQNAELSIQISYKRQSEVAKRKNMKILKALKAILG